MAKILIINNHRENKKPLMKTGGKGSIKVGLIGVGFLMIFASAFYLFQVNSLAIKGYEVKELENKISELEKENKKMQIREMEFRSMYVIEKSAQNFNLVSPENVTYLEVNSTVAIK